MEESRILIVEDVAQNRTLLRSTVLKDFEHVFEAANGREALEILETEHSIDIILLDLIMPEMDGIEFLRNLNNRDKDIPVLVLSSTSEIKMAIDSLRLGARDFLEKPYNKELILKRVEDLLSDREDVQQSDVLFVGEDFSYGELQNIFDDKKENIFVVSTFDEAIELLENAFYGVMITDLSNNKDAIRQFLSEVLERYPHIVSLVTAKEEDKLMVFDLVDEGLVRDMVLDPIDLNEMSMTVMNALIYYHESSQLQLLRLKNLDN
ncbi:MAG: response regulator [Fibrobacterales bacterium]